MATMSTRWLAPALLAAGFPVYSTALAASPSSATCSLMESVLDPGGTGKYTFSAELMAHERLLKSITQFCTATLGTNKQPAVRLIYETFDDAMTASENVTAGEPKFTDHRPSSIDNIAGQTVYWKGTGRGPLSLTFLINNLYVTIYEGPFNQNAGSDAIRAHEPFVRDQMRRLAAAVVSSHKRRD